MKEHKKTTLCFLDYFIIATVLLLIIGIMGQDIAVYAINKYNSEQQFEVDFISYSVDYEKASSMFASTKEQEGTVAFPTFRSGDRVLGEVRTTPVFEKIDLGTAPTEASSKEKCNVKGSFFASGRMKDEGVRIAKFGSVESGDVLMVVLGKQALAIEIQDIHLITEQTS